MGYVRFGRVQVESVKNASPLPTTAYHRLKNAVPLRRGLSSGPSAASTTGRYLMIRGWRGHLVRLSWIVSGCRR